MLTTTQRSHQALSRPRPAFQPPTNLQAAAPRLPSRSRCVLARASSGRAVALEPAASLTEPLPSPASLLRAASGGLRLPAPPSTAAPSDWELLVQRWVRRTVTKRDFLHSHAISNALFLVGGLLLELTTNASWAAGFQDSLWYPQWWEMLAIQAVTAVSTGTGLVLTAENRKGAERLVFQTYGLQVLQSAMMVLWMSPSWPLRDCHAADIAMGGSSILTSLYALVEVQKNKDEAMAQRNKQPSRQPSRQPAEAAAGAAAADPAAAATTAQQGEAPAPAAQQLSQQAWYQDLMYWFPSMPGPTFTVIAGLLQAHDGRLWLDAFSAQHPEYLAATFHIVMVTTLAGHAGMFAITLRDKKLISQATELAITGTTNLGSLVYVGALFAHFPWMVQTMGIHAFPLLG